MASPKPPQPATRQQAAKPAPAKVAGQPAARVGDKHVCPHAGPASRIATGSPNVEVNRMKLARFGDLVQCGPNKNFIVTGAAKVTVNGKLAARVTSLSMHQGTEVKGSPNVLIGGPSGGGTLGNPTAAVKSCQEIGATRATPGPLQFANNCGVETARLLVHAVTGSAVSEQQILTEAIAAGDAQNGLPTGNLGLTTVQQTSNILSGNAAGAASSPYTYGQVANAIVPQTPGTVLQSVAEGKGVITNMAAGPLWNMPSLGTSGHAIVVSGVDFDGHGKITGWHTVDTAAPVNGVAVGTCDRVISDATMTASLSGPTMNVTSKPIW